MNGIKKENTVCMDEYDELSQLHKSLKSRWENSEKWIAQLEEDSPLLREWSYKTLIYKQMYRYVLRLLKKRYEEDLTRWNGKPFL